MEDGYFIDKIDQLTELGYEYNVAFRQLQYESGRKKVDEERVELLEEELEDIQARINNVWDAFHRHQDEEIQRHKDELQDAIDLLKRKGYKIEEK